VKPPGALAFPLTLALFIGAPILVGLLWPDLIAAMLYGAAAWALALIVKLALARTKAIRSLQRAGVAGAMAWGLFSGAAELGAFAGVLALNLLPMTAAHGAAAGLGAAVLEAFYIIVSGLIAEARQPPAPERAAAWESGARQSAWIAYVLPIERGAAALVHIGARGLVTLGFSTASIAPIALALLTFTAVDGLATYGTARSWNWFDPAIAARYYLFVLVAGGANLALLALAASG
jgi:hypothetical protein